MATKNAAHESPTSDKTVHGHKRGRAVAYFCMQIIHTISQLIWEGSAS